MTVKLVHLSDLHFGARTKLGQIEAVEETIPDLQPDAVVLSGDLSDRARHGELQRARAFVRLAAKTAPVYVLPGNHDLSWWWRPLGPLARGMLYRKYRRYFGVDLAPTLTLPGAVIAGVLTSDGATWGTVTWRLGDVAVKGHLPKSEYLRVRRVFAEAPREVARVLVVHHNVLRGKLSRRTGLVHRRRATGRILDCGAEVVLCGHDHQEAADLLAQRVVVCTAGTLCTRSRGGRASSFNLITIEPAAVRVSFFRWDDEREQFQPSTPLSFDRVARVEHAGAC